MFYVYLVPPIIYGSIHNRHSERSGGLENPQDFSNTALPVLFIWEQTLTASTRHPRVEVGQWDEPWTDEGRERICRVIRSMIIFIFSMLRLRNPRPSIHSRQIRALS